MNFSQQSDITVVVTSCGRFDLLARTLASFDRFNTAAIRKVLITEDSGDEAVRSVVPADWLPHTEFIVNRPRRGQMRSIDLAYARITTPWVFHCEDDWEFYRPGFIEDSRKHLEADSKALQVWLRSHAHDLSRHSPYVSLGERRVVDGVAAYVVKSSKADWQGFSFNPGLRRQGDYLLHAPYAEYGGEKELSKLYASEGRYALILENDAVLHTGFGEHVQVPEERKKKRRRKRLEMIKIVLAFIVGLIIGWVV
jgi:hypothetical protein